MRACTTASMLVPWGTHAAKVQWHYPLPWAEALTVLSSVGRCKSMLAKGYYSPHQWLAGDACEQSACWTSTRNDTLGWGRLEDHPYLDTLTPRHAGIPGTLPFPVLYHSC